MVQPFTINIVEEVAPGNRPLVYDDLGELVAELDPVTHKLLLEDLPTGLIFGVSSVNNRAGAVDGLAEADDLDAEIARALQVEAELEALIAARPALPAVHRWDVRSFLINNEVWVTDGSVNMSTILQRAINAAADAYPTAGPIQVFVPDGHYRITTALVAKSGVGIVGESTAGTIFLPQGSQSFMNGTAGSVGTPYVDNVFTNFSIDGSAQTSTAYTTNIKGIYIRHMLRARFQNVNIFNTYATGFGVDYLRDSFFDDCLAEGCGRGLTDPLTQSGGSGFGIGTGASLRESVTITGCVASNNGFNGFFTEKQQAFTYYSTGFRMIGCHSYGNYNGFKDCGTRGALIIGCQFTENRYAGVSIDSTILAPDAGYEGIVADCVISGNNTSGIADGGGVVIGSARLGRYSIKNNEIFLNTGNGIRIKGSVASGFNISGNDIYKNTASGIRSSTVTSLSYWSITRNRCYSNGTDATQTYRSGILIESPMVNCNIRYNECFDNQTVKTQQYGIRLVGSLNDTAVAVTENDLRFNKIASFSNEHTFSADSILRNNDGFSLAQVNSLAIAGIASGTVSLRWTGPAGVSGVSDYLIQYSGDSSEGPWTTFAHTPSTATTVTITGLTDGTTYHFRVAHLVSSTQGEFSGCLCDAACSPPARQLQPCGRLGVTGLDRWRSPRASSLDGLVGRCGRMGDCVQPSGTRCWLRRGVRCSGRRRVRRHGPSQSRQRRRVHRRTGVPCNRSLQPFMDCLANRSQALACAGTTSRSAPRRCDPDSPRSVSVPVDVARCRGGRAGQPRRDHSVRAGLGVNAAW